MRNSKLAREQLDARLAQLRTIKDTALPVKGWIRAIRSALGMQGKQLAARLRISPQSLAEIEASEIPGSVSIKTMRRVAEALDAEFVYAIVPKKTLEEMVRVRAQSIAQSRLSRVSHTMALEDQALSQRQNELTLARLVEEIVQKTPPALWDETT